MAAPPPKRPTVQPGAGANPRGGRSQNFQWQCAVCRTNNPPSSAICRTCQQTRRAPPVLPRVSGRSGGQSSPSVGDQVRGFLTNIRNFVLGEGGQTSGPDPWTCEHCTFENADGGNACAMCALPRHRLDVGQVPPSRPTPTPRPPASRGTSVDALEHAAERYMGLTDSLALWKCERCECLNHTSVLQCPLCGLVNPLITVSPGHGDTGASGDVAMDVDEPGNTEDPSSTSSNEWTCATCTLRNPMSALLCNACNTPGPSLALHRQTSMKRQASIVSESAASNPTASLSLMGTMRLDERRRVLEERATEQWLHIVQYCNAVSTVMNDHTIYLYVHSVSCHQPSNTV